MGVMIVASERYLFGGESATNLEVSFQHHYLLSCLAQVGGYAEPVGPAAYDDEVIFIICHLILL